MKPRLPYAPIPISQPVIGLDERESVLAVLESGMLVQGAVTKKLEDGWSDVVGVGHAVATNNGTSALHVALLANGVGEGDEVITTPFTFIASVNAILMCNAIPVFADILPGCYTIDPASIEALITPRTKAILPVHLFGQPAKLGEIGEIADRHGLAIIEDCAQSIGATYAGRQTGSFGTGAFSLYATKNVMSAEGGMVTTNSLEIASVSRLLREHGSPRRYHHDILGYNYRMSDLHAAIGVSQLAKLQTFTARRQRNAMVLSEGITSLVTPRIRDANVTHVWHQYTVTVPKEGSSLRGLDREAILRELTDQGIGCGVFYPTPAYRQPHLSRYAEQHGGVDAIARRCPVAEMAAQSVLSLPVHPQLSEDDLDRILVAMAAL